MDATKRHQLKQNELAEALARLRHLDSPATRFGLLALAVVLAVIGGWKLWGYRRAHTIFQEWQRYAALDARLPPASPQPDGATVDELSGLAADASTPALAAAARLRLARYHIDQAERNPDRRGEELRRAATLLEQTVGQPDTPASLAAAARFALATAYESLRELDKARATYQSLVDERERYAGSPVIDLADRRLQTLGELAAAVELRPGEPPPPPPPVVDGPPAPPAAAGRLGTGFPEDLPTVTAELRQKSLARERPEPTEGGAEEAAPPPATQPAPDAAPEPAPEPPAATDDETS